MGMAETELTQEHVDKFLEGLRERMLKADGLRISCRAGSTRIEDWREHLASHEHNGTFTCTIEINGGARDDVKTVGPSLVFTG